MGINWDAGLATGKPLFGKKGGKVPGKGPKRAIVHGGETIVPPGKTLSAMKKKTVARASGSKQCNYGPMKHFRSMGLGEK